MLKHATHLDDSLRTQQTSPITIASLPPICHCQLAGPPSSWLTPHLAGHGDTLTRRLTHSAVRRPGVTLSTDLRLLARYRPAPSGKPRRRNVPVPCQLWCFPRGVLCQVFCHLVLAALPALCVPIWQPCRILVLFLHGYLIW